MPSPTSQRETPNTPYINGPIGLAASRQYLHSDERERDVGLAIASKEQLARMLERLLKYTTFDQGLSSSTNGHIYIVVRTPIPLLLLNHTHPLHNITTVSHAPTLAHLVS